MSWLVLDVSKYNDISDYATCAKSIDGVIMRCGYRGYGSSGSLQTDNHFSAHYNGFNGKTKIGMYWFSTAITTTEAVAEANYVYNLVKGKIVDFPIYIDSEYSNADHNGRSDSLSKSVRTNVTVAFCDRIKELGYKAGVYASDSWFKTNLDLPTLQAKGYSLWVAKYSTNKPTYVTSYDAWQYTSTGTINGYSGRVDLSYFYNDVAGWGGGTTPTVTDISKFTITLNTYSVTYTGSVQTPVVTVDNGNKRIGTDYTVSYSNNINVGTGTVTVTGINNYNGSKSINFTINAKNIDSYTLSVSADSLVYDGKAKTPNSYISGLNKGTDYDISYSNNINAGTGTVTATGKGNYTGKKEAVFTINKKPISDYQFTIPRYIYKYTGSAITPQVTCTDTSGLNKTYSIAYSNNTNLGIATITITGSGNFSGTVKIEFEISDMNVSKMKINIQELDFVYTPGKEWEPKVTIDRLTEGNDFTVEYSNNINAGTATVKVIGKGEYEGTNTATFSIKPRNIALEHVLTCEQTKYPYTKSEIKPTGITDGLVNNVDYKLSYENNRDIGIGTIIATGINNYTGQITCTFEIVSVSISTVSANYGYWCKYSEYWIDNGILTLSSNGVILEKDVDYKVISIDKYYVKDKDYDTIVTCKVEALVGFTDTVDFYFKLLQNEPVGGEEHEKPEGGNNYIDDGDDDLKYNFGDIDLKDETAEGDYDFEDLDEGVDKDNVADGDYDFNILSNQTIDDMWDPGKSFELDNTPIYANYCSEASCGTRSGIYYVWNSKISMGKIRLTHDLEGVKAPARSCGWFSTTDLENLGKIVKGDAVIVNGEIYNYADGSGTYIEKKDALMYVVDVVDETKYDFPYGLATGPTLTRQGWAGLSSIKKKK
jgi:GH25 family lysozyme M1 (1,4-beta-N-acetylmuramidase)